jgi:hypothetical protein
MTTSRKIIDGLRDALAFAKGDTSAAARVTEYVVDPDGMVEKSPRIARDASEARGGGGDVPETASTASADEPGTSLAGSGRVIDPDRAGGTGNAAPKRIAITTEPIAIDEALAYVESIRWRSILPYGHLAMLALADEVDRLRAELADAYALHEREATAWGAAYRMATAQEDKPSPDPIVPPEISGAGASQ